jgi:hypothetical protein
LISVGWGVGPHERLLVHFEACVHDALVRFWRELIRSTWHFAIGHHEDYLAAESLFIKLERLGTVTIEV